ncbi:MAG: thioredoxin family protein, partial [Blautia sp.]
ETRRQVQAEVGGITGNPGSLFTPDMLSQLNTVFSKMEGRLQLRLYLDTSSISQELSRYMEELGELTDKLDVVELEGEEAERDLPCVKVCREDGDWTGLAFHGVPGGHEFTSFILGLYNAAGPGQALDSETSAQIQAIDRPVDMKILVSLSCTMCPELVTAAQKIATENPRVTAEVYDLNHFPQLREKYNVMSVPCLVVDGDQVSFGKKNVQQLLDLLR